MRSALALGRCAGEKDSLTSGVAGVQIPDKIPSAFVTQNLLSPGALLGSLGAMLDHRGRRVALSNPPGSEQYAQARKSGVADRKKIARSRRRNNGSDGITCRRITQRSAAVRASLRRFASAGFTNSAASTNTTSSREIPIAQAIPGFSRP